MMYEAAKKHGVEFYDIQQRAALAPPAEIQLMCERFVAGDYRITAAEEHLLKLRYIHQSAHWSPTFLTGPRTTRFELAYAHIPTADAVRVHHPHVPEWTL